MSKKHPRHFRRTVLSLLIGGMGVHQTAMAGDFLSLAQYPAGSAVKEPAPNVIISIDNSGSMSLTSMGVTQQKLMMVINPTLSGVPTQNQQTRIHLG